MLGGGHARRRSIGSIIEASPCVRVEKRKHQGKVFDDYYDSPNKARIVEKPSIASTSSYQFGGERMIKAQRGLLERQSLEDSCLIADGEDFSNLSEFHDNKDLFTFNVPVQYTRYQFSLVQVQLPGPGPAHVLPALAATLLHYQFQMARLFLGVLNRASIFRISILPWLTLHIPFHLSPVTGLDNALLGMVIAAAILKHMLHARQFMRQLKRRCQLHHHLLTPFCRRKVAPQFLYLFSLWSRTRHLSTR